LIATTPGGPRRYLRRLDADEIQYQVSGRRRLITQRGILDLEPGDFVRVPLGVSQSSATAEPGRYLSLLSHRELPQVAETTRVADAYSPERLKAVNVEVHS
jgi:homogentisate 1,2-dioxygenase